MRGRVGLVAVALAVAACGGGDDGPSAEAFCDVQTRIAAIPMLSGDSPDEVRAAMDDLRGLFDEMVAAAPSDVRAAAESSRGSAIALIDLIASVDYDEARIPQDALDTLASEARDASADLLTWVDANCGS